MRVEYACQAYRTSCWGKSALAAEVEQRRRYLSSYSRSCGAIAHARLKACSTQDTETVNPL